MYVIFSALTAANNHITCFLGPESIGCRSSHPIRTIRCRRYGVKRLRNSVRALTPLSFPRDKTVNSGVFPNVLLTQGAIASLAIIPLGVLDVQAGATVLVGDGGYQIPFLQLQQTNVPTQYDLDLLLSPELLVNANRTFYFISM